MLPWQISLLQRSLVFPKRAQILRKLKRQPSKPILDVSFHNRNRAADVRKGSTACLSVQGSAIAASIGDNWWLVLSRLLVAWVKKRPFTATKTANGARCERLAQHH